MATITSHGAAGVVTGSCHLFEIEGGARILIDCGMFQDLKRTKMRVHLLLTQRQ